MKETDKRLFLIDAMALVYRSYFALMSSPRMTTTGKNTNAQFGFTNAILDLIKNQNPTHVAVVWDAPGPTKRHEIFEDYKANRLEVPEDIRAAIPDIKKITTAFKFPNIELKGYEADDIIGAMAFKASEQGYEVYMVTPDKDYGQLVGENRFIYKPGSRGAGYEILGVEEIKEEWDIEHPLQLIDILGLMGDSSDNIPGVHGVGKKTAAKLLKEYESVEGIIAAKNNIKGKLGERIREHEDIALLSKQLATIDLEVPLEFIFEDYLVEGMDAAMIQEVFAELEFRSLAKRILVDVQDGQGDLFAGSETAFAQNSSKDLMQDMFALKSIKDVEKSYHLVNSTEQIQDFIQKATQQKVIALDTETTSLDPRAADLVGISFSWKKDEAYYLPAPQDFEACKVWLKQFANLFENQDIEWVGQNFKYDINVLRRYDVLWKAPYFDTLVAMYVLHPTAKKDLSSLSEQFLEYQMQSIETLIGKKGKNQKSMADIPVEEVLQYAAEDADVTFQLKDILEKELIKDEQDELFRKIDNPLVLVLAKMEYEGVNLDVDFLGKYAKELEKAIQKAAENIFAGAGMEFNIASPKQLGEVLFDHMKLDEKAKKTKTGQYKTGEDVLLKLQHKDPIIQDILIFRELSKLKSTYADALPKLILEETGHIHTSFNQTVVSTGRLSSNQPNLQNIPIRTKIGRMIREAFIPRNEDYVLLAADYSQIELRIVAALSGDETMIQAFKDNKDIHSATAAKVYALDEEEVTSEQRRNAKAVNFGIIYGQSAFGLSETLGISRGEAKAIIDSYFLQYPSIQTYMDETIEFAKEHGYVETLKGRKIVLDNINSANFTVRGFAERLAINARIQGSAAEMIKIAMIQIQETMEQKQMKSRMILQVHDELIFDVHKDEKEVLREMVIDLMQNAMTLINDVPVIVDTGFGENWLEAH